MLFWVRLKKTLHNHPRRPALILLSLLLVLVPLHAGNIPCKFSTDSKIVAVADIHGDYDNFEKILRGTGLIDGNNDWIGGTTHLVQLGDILDRGDDAKESFDLLMKLEKQAEAAGGMVHMLIGNHEVANITGIVFDQSGYMTWRQLLSFLPGSYVEIKQRAIREKSRPTDGPDGKFDAEYERFWMKEIDAAQGRLDNKTREAYTKNFYEKYGKWLLTKNIVIKINDIVFVHGGLSIEEYYLERDLETINSEARRELRIIAEWAADPNRGALSINPEDLKYVMQPQAPHWYRGWAQEPENGNSATLDQVLAKYKAKHMIIGHTVRAVEYIETRELERFGRRVWAIDVGISDFYNDLLFALIIEKGEQGSVFIPWWGDDEKK
jgi:hypothetical protein